MSIFQYRRKFIKSPWDFGYYAELETISDNKSNLAINLYNDDGDYYWIYISLFYTKDCIYIMDLKGFHLDSYYLINLYEVNYKHEDHEYIKQKIIKKFYPYHQIKTKDDFVIYNCVNQIIFNVIEKHKLFDIFGNILPYDVIELFVTNNSINLDDFKISKTFDIHKFANTYDNEEINKEWFTNYSEMFKNYIYFE